MRNNLKQLVKSTTWINFQFAITITAASFSFLAILLDDMGVTIENICIIMSLLYLGTIVTAFKPSKQITGITLLATSLTLPFLSNNPYYFGVVFAFFVALMQSSRDIMSVGMMTKFNEIAKKISEPLNSVIATAHILGLFITISIMTLTGFILNTDQKTYIYIIAFAGGVTALGLIKNKNKNEIKSHRAKLPVSIHRICSLTFFVNIPTFYLRFLIVPLITIQVSTDLGFEDDVFSITGTLIGALTLISFILKSKKRTNNKKGMVSSIIAMLCLSAILAFVALFIYERENAVISSLLYFIILVSMEAFTKSWSIYFLAYLTENITKYRDIHQKRAYNLFVRYKAIAGFSSFGLSYLIFNTIDPYLFLLLTSVISLFICIYLTNNNTCKLTSK